MTDRPPIEERTVEILFCEGVEENSLYIDNFRVCGPKPWGGGQILNYWEKVPLKDILKALGLDTFCTLDLERKLAEAEKRLQKEVVHPETGVKVMLPVESIIEALEARVRELENELKILEMDHESLVSQYNRIIAITREEN